MVSPRLSKSATEPSTGTRETAQTEILSPSRPCFPHPAEEEIQSDRRSQRVRIGVLGPLRKHRHDRGIRVGVHRRNLSYLRRKTFVLRFHEVITGGYTPEFPLDISSTPQFECMAHEDKRWSCRENVESV
jgi:hypothetical protein